ncbi:MAG: hypothetical protein K2R98_08715 [Gemmataceae bacterium]|nr:hypothetical protein [Gemmataceae bacterium]
MSKPELVALEDDPRFPSGPWTGFFLQKLVPGRHLMELHLMFQQGTISGEGRDWVGHFTVRGRYEVADGRCRFHKRYHGKHDVFYQGFNEGRGIWGTWEIDLPDHFYQKGGFHIWPEGMANPTDDQLAEEAEPPLHVDDLQEVREHVPVGGKNR